MLLFAFLVWVINFTKPWNVKSKTNCMKKGKKKLSSFWGNTSQKQIQMTSSRASSITWTRQYLDKWRTRLKLNQKQPNIVYKIHLDQSKACLQAVTMTQWKNWTLACAQTQVKSKKETSWKAQIIWLSQINNFRQWLKLRTLLSYLWTKWLCSGRLQIHLRNCINLQMTFS